MINQLGCLAVQEYRKEHVLPLKQANKLWLANRQTRSQATGWMDGWIHRRWRSDALCQPTARGDRKSRILKNFSQKRPIKKEIYKATAIYLTCKHF